MKEILRERVALSEKRSWMSYCVTLGRLTVCTLREQFASVASTSKSIAVGLSMIIQFDKIRQWIQQGATSRQATGGR